MNHIEATQYIKATLAEFGLCTHASAIQLRQETWAKLHEAMNVLIEQPAQQEPVTIGEPVGWHSKQYGFVYMALQPHQFEVGSTLCLKNGTPAWRIESSCSMTALISMSSLPHGTVFYTSPPAQRKSLTDEEIEEMANDFEEGYVFLYRSFARAIEAAHGIKGDA